MTVLRLRTVALWFVFSLSFGTQGQSLSIDDFLAPRHLVDVAVSPDGRYLANVWENEGIHVLNIYDLQESKLVTQMGDEIIRPYRVDWLNQDRIIVRYRVPYDTNRVRKRAAENDDFDIRDYAFATRAMAMDMNGENVTFLMEDKRNVKRASSLSNIAHWLPNDEQHIIILASYGSKLTQFKANIYTGETQKLLSGSRFTYGFVFDDDGNTLYRYDYRWLGKKIYIYEKNKQSWDKIETLYLDGEDQDKNATELYDLMGNLNGDLVYRKRNADTGYYELITRDSKTKKTSVLASVKNKDIKGVIYNRYGTSIIGYHVSDHIRRNIYFSKNSQNYYNRIAQNFDNRNFVLIDSSDDGKKAIVLAHGMHDPSSYYLYDNNKGKAVLIADAYKTLPKTELAQGHILSYNTRDGLPMTAYVYVPKEFTGKSALPAVIMPHGGPQARDRATYNDFAQFIATRGYIVIKPNFRGSTGYGKIFEEAGYKQWGLKMQEDLEDAVAFLVNEQIADPDKVCIVGISYGGYAALMGAVKTPDLYQCSVGINGVTHLPDQIEFDLDKFEDEKTRQYVLDSIGDPKNDMAQLVSTSPQLQADKIKIPILLIAGEEDDVVPFEQSEDMHDVLEDLGIPSRLIAIEDTGHNVFRYRDDRKTVYREVAAFLQKYLEHGAQ